LRRLVKREKSVNRARIISADDHEEMRDQIKSLLDNEFEVLDLVGDGLSLLDAAARLQPDVCLLDISMPILNGIETAEQLKQRGSAAKIVFLTIHEDQDFLEAALKAGASAYVLKRRMALDLRPAIVEALAGRTFISACPSLRIKPKRSELSPPGP
jgi:DNA-binding NarL/FixJ family response regulator